MTTNDELRYGKETDERLYIITVDYAVEIKEGRSVQKK